MRSLVFLMVLFVALIPKVSAHFKMGRYIGIDKQNKKCEVLFLKKVYRFGVKNPLNEIVLVKESKTGLFDLRHPLAAKWKKKQMKARKDLLRGARGTRTGAVVLEIKMAHGPKINGPVSFRVAKHNWKTNSYQVRTCFNLKFNK